MRHTKARGVLGFWHFFSPQHHRLWLFGCNKDFQLKIKFFFRNDNEATKTKTKEKSLPTENTIAWSFKPDGALKKKREISRFQFSHFFAFFSFLALKWNLILLPCVLFSVCIFSFSSRQFKLLPRKLACVCCFP